MLTLRSFCKLTSSLKGKLLSTSHYFTRASQVLVGRNSCALQLRLKSLSSRLFHKTYVQNTECNKQNVNEQLCEKCHVKSCCTDECEGQIALEFSDQSVLKYPFVWLRDNCQCEECFHPGSRSRTIEWKDFDVDVKPVSCTVDCDGSGITINWCGGHVSAYTAEWLAERSFTKESRAQWLYEYQQPRVTWGADNFTCVPQFQFSDLLSRDSHLLAWLQALHVFGVVLVKDVPPEENQVRQLVNRVGFIKKTHYGEEFAVKAKSDPNNVAYTGNPLQLHTDLPYYEYKPGVNLLHCLVQHEGDGGENQLVDFLHVAKQLRHQHPDVYSILTTTLVDWSDVGVENGNEFHKVYRAPVICEDWSGDIVRLNYSHPQRDSHFTVPLDRVQKWYRAMRVLTDLMYLPDNSVYYKMNSGDMLTFDNLRICHGRSGYHSNSNGQRHLIGAYMDWDEIRSRMRVLRTRLRD